MDREVLQAAREKGKLKGALARAFKSSDFNIPADIPERIEAALRQAVLDRLGLEARASMVVTGSEKIETAARRGRSEEHTSELQSLMRNSYAVFCLKKTTNHRT